MNNVKKFSHNNKTFGFRPFNTRSKRNLARKPNEIVLTKSSYNLSGDWCRLFNFNTSVINYVVFADDEIQKDFIHFAIAEGDEGKSALMEMFNVTPNKMMSRKDEKSNGGFWGNIAPMYNSILSDLHQKIIEEKKMTFPVEKSPLTDENQLISCFHFNIPVDNESWISISPLELKKTTSLSHKKGNYRYFDVDDNVIYIGHGSIRGRFLSTNENRSAWGIERVEYLECEDENQRKSLEKEFISKFEKEYGSLPKFNSNRGG